ncbi:MAG: hypothetical protein JWN70_6835 [Planctomycetaceae bacterium]|nr:hypothetical protein [Planctomycetaceae bacterium]
MMALKLSSTIYRAILTVVLCGVVAGCGSSGPPAPKVGTVSGKVKFKGEPVKEGQVLFEDPTQGQLAGANLKSDGTYYVTTAEGGLRVGTYGVKVTAVPVASDPVMNPKPVPPADPANIPKKYRNAKTSGLTLVVKQGGNTYDIEMTE